MLDRKRIGEILVELGLLSPAEVERVLDALRRRGGMTKFGEIAAAMGLVNDEHILAALAVQMQLFKDASEISFERLLGRLREPIKTPAPIPLKKVRRRLASK